MSIQYNMQRIFYKIVHLINRKINKNIKIECSLFICHLLLLGTLFRYIPGYTTQNKTTTKIQRPRSVIQMKIPRMSFTSNISGEDSRRFWKQIFLDGAFRNKHFVKSITISKLQKSGHKFNMYLRENIPLWLSLTFHQ